MNNEKMRYYVGSLQGCVKEGIVQWEYGTYAFGRFETQEEAVIKGAGIIEYINGHHTGFKEGTLKRATEDFKKDERVLPLWWEMQQMWREIRQIHIHCPNLGKA